jgi:hypothetical protein
MYKKYLNTDINNNMYMCIYANVFICTSTNIIVKVHPSRTACLYLLVRIELPRGEENKRNAKYIYLILFDDQVNKMWEIIFFLRIFISKILKKTLLFNFASLLK